MTEGTTFKPLIVDTFGQDVETLIFCSGFIYFKMLKIIGDSKPKIAIARVEELAPFPLQHTQSLLKSHPWAKKIVWVQDENLNSGGF